MRLQNNNSGLSLLLTIFILSGLLIVGLAASDLVLRASRTSRQIGTSEVAYYAAESAAEIVLYRLEKENTDITTLNDSGALVEVDAEWTRGVTADTEGPQTSNVYAESPGVIDNSNPLKVKLDNGQSFELRLDINGVDYPNNLQIRWSGANGSKVIVYNKTDEEQDVGEHSPVNINVEQSKSYVLRIVNASGNNDVVYSIEPGGDDPLPVGLIISTIGKYLEQERRLELDNRKWQIY